MEFINTVIGTPLGYLMWVCYWICKNYGLAIILFTVLTKVILFPINIWVQKNSIKMVKLQPEVNQIMARHVDVYKRQQMFRTYYHDKFAAGTILSTVEEAGQYLLPQFLGRREETVYLVCLDNKDKAVSYTHLDVYKRQMPM